MQILIPTPLHSSGLSDFRNRTKRTKQTDQRELVRPSVFPLGERTDGSILPLGSIKEGRTDE
jgi:hypothetical protein